jgi:lipoprotein NlpD
VRLLHILVAVLGSALLAACASDYRAPVAERSVTRSSAPLFKPPAPVTAPAIEQRAETYTVKRGDTLYSIALDKGVDYKELAAWNNMSDPAVLKPGAVLRLRPPAAQQQAQPDAGAQIQPGAGVQVQPVLTPGSVEAHSLGGDARAATDPQRTTPEPRAAAAVARPELLKTGPKAMKLPYSEENVALLLRQAPREAKVEAPVPQPNAGAESDGVDWMWPASGRVLAGFAKGTNKGVDILGRVGDPVFASASGRVVYSGTGLRGYGKLIIIKHNDTYLSAYAHNSNLLVKEGQSVARGQKIAEIGNSDSPQVKLHFEIRRLGEPVDPLKFLPERRS